MFFLGPAVRRSIHLMAWAGLGYAAVYAGAQVAAFIQDPTGSHPGQPVRTIQYFCQFLHSPVELALLAGICALLGRPPGPADPAREDFADRPRAGG